MYQENKIMDNKEKEFIDSIVKEVFEPVEKEKDDIVNKIFVLGILMGIYSQEDESIDRLTRIAELDFSDDVLSGAKGLSSVQKTIPHLQNIIPINPNQKKYLELAKMQVGNYITGITDDTRKEIRDEIIRAQMEGKHPQQLSHELFKKFKTLRKNWRLIAISESTNISMIGFLSTLKEGDRVTAHSLPDACQWCKDLLNGRTFIFTENPPVSDTDPKQETHTWIGKTNFNKKRNDWKPGVIICHPGCRCWWSIAL